MKLPREAILPRGYSGNRLTMSKLLNLESTFDAKSSARVTVFEIFCRADFGVKLTRAGQILNNRVDEKIRPQISNKRSRLVKYTERTD